MHELSLVGELVEACTRRAGGARVTLVRVRHAATIPEAALRAAFDVLVEGTPLAGAALETDLVEVRLRCACGFSGPLGHDDVAAGIAAGIAVCPACGAVSRAEGTAELELLEVRAAR